MKSIAFFHAGGPELCSSRIRSIQLEQTLPCLGVKVHPRNWLAADTVFIQKKISPGRLVIAAFCKLLGKRVMYDIDDAVQELKFWHPAAPSLLPFMFNLADTVTTDTEGRKRFLEDAFGLIKVQMISDGIDYFPRGPSIPPKKEADKIRVLWFGSYPTLKLFEKYAAGLCSIDGVQLVIITSAQLIDALRKKYPAADLIPWSLSDFAGHLQSCQLSVLMHDGSDADLLKSNNKMIASITWGVPAIVSQTPEYERTARELGVSDTVFSSEHQLRAIIGRYAYPAARAAYLDKTQKKVWDSYCPTAQSRQLIDIIATNTIHQVPLVRCIRTIVVCLRIMTVMQIKKMAKTVLPTFMLRDDSLIMRFYRKLNKTPMNLMRPSDVVEVRDYRRQWINPEGKPYRDRTFERQSKYGEKPLTSNPTIDEIRQALRSNNAKTVLEIGCGWGRLMEDLTGEFDIMGCDVARDNLERCPSHLKTFFYDIAVEDPLFVNGHLWKWDVLFTRGVMLYLFDHPLQATFAMNNMLMLASKKIIIWEWPEVCDQMKLFSNNVKFEYHPIRHQEE